jgi:hypothetical protein
MNIKKRFAWGLIIAVAILVSAAIIFLSGQAYYGGNKLEETEMIVERSAKLEAVVQEFYTWYLESIGDRAAGTFQNPLTDQVYQNSEYLTPSFIERVDEILADFGERGGYDPFLCAQDIPQEM